LRDAVHYVRQGDAQGVGEAADVGAHAGGLPGGVDFEDGARGNAVGAA